jgi:hypothetical protein
MKKIYTIKTCLLWILTAAFVVGCNKDESPFAGTDNHIAAFTLVKDGITLKGAVSPDAIVLTAPECFSLAGATAHVTLSENATIAPDPVTTTDWEAAQTFTVTAYNGTQHTYNYRLERRLVSHDGDVTLLTQADVDAFVAELEGSQINGSLTVGAATGADSVYSLAGLEQLKVIIGGIIINATYAGEDLTVFEQLEKTGELVIRSKLLKTVSFPKLSAIHADLNLDQATKIGTLNFPELVTIDKGLRIYYVDSLETLHFPKLQKVRESVTVQGRSSGTQKLQAVRFPELTTVGGTFTSSYLSKTESVAVPKLESVAALTLSNCAALTEMDFRALQSAGTYYANGLTNVAEIDVRGKEIGSLELYGSTQTGLTLIGDDSFAGRLYLGAPVSGTTAFPITVQGFKTVGTLEVSVSYLTAIDFPWLERVTKLLYFSSGSTVQRINLPNLVSAGGLQIGYYNALTALELPSLGTITGYTSGTATVGNFTYAVSSNIAAVVLPKLQSITGNLSITGLTATRPLATIGFPALQSLTGTLTLTGTNNAYFTDLSGFSALTSTAGITISNFTQLKNFEPLQHVIPALSADTWKVSGCSYNPTYQNMLDGNYTN